jgi:hypothetical protein
MAGRAADRTRVIFAPLVVRRQIPTGGRFHELSFAPISFKKPVVVPLRGYSSVLGLWDPL